MESASLLKAGFMVLMAAHVLPLVSGCSRGFYDRMIHELCLANFKSNLGGLDPGLWCSWPDTMEMYEDLTNCTFQVALGVGCFWPNQMVDRFFMQIHQSYFHDCALTGRLIHDPPPRILAPFIAVPVLVTLLMTALVVWRSKRTKGVL